MIIRTLSVLALLGGAVVAQDTPPALTRQAPAQGQSTEAESLFYKAFFLDRHASQRDAAVALYTQFLEKAPSHSYAKIAAQNAHILLMRDGKAEEASSFKTKYAALINADADRNVAGDARPERAAGERGQRGERGEGGMRQRGEGQPGRGRVNMDELQAELAKAKEAGDEAKVKELEERIKQIEERRAAGGRGGQGGRGGMAGFQLLQRKVTDLNEEEVGQLSTFLDGFAPRMIERMRDGGQDEQATKLEKSVAAFKKALAEGNKEEAEKLRTEITASMPQGRRRGGN